MTDQPQPVVRARHKQRECSSLIVLCLYVSCFNWLVRIGASVGSQGEVGIVVEGGRTKEFGLKKER
jgi:hypothetical protein